MPIDLSPHFRVRFKRYNPIVITMLCLIAGIQSVSAQVSFVPELYDVVSAYKDTEPVKLPKPDKSVYELLDDEYAYPPGFMPLPLDVVINKSKRRLSLVTRHGDEVGRFPVCSSRNRGQKRKKDDCKTPEGTFEIIGVYNSTDWTYKDTGQKAYGPFFVHLYTAPFFGIGIHGTNAPFSVPGRSSHGCVRMHNETITRLHKMLSKDSRVTILSDTIQDVVEGEGVRIDTEKGTRKPLHPSVKKKTPQQIAMREFHSH